MYDLKFSRLQASSALSFPINLVTIYKEIKIPLNYEPRYVFFIFEFDPLCGLLVHLALHTRLKIVVPGSLLPLSFCLSPLTLLPLPL